MESVFSSLTEIQLRDICRHHIDSFENWSRRLLDETFKNAYGKDYFDHRVSVDQPLIRSEVKKRIDQRIADNPNRFPRRIDAILMEDIDYFFCRQDLYAAHFEKVFKRFFSGTGEIHSVLDRLIKIRNKLSHGNTISYHEAEQCICYSNDFIETYKQYYVSLGKEETYNVPVILRIKDNLGNDFIREDSRYAWKLPGYLPGHPEIRLRSGDEYRLQIEVDSSFDRSFYKIQWAIAQNYNTLCKGTGNEIIFHALNKNVSYAPTIYIKLTTIRDWHRFHEIDDSVEIHLNPVLPPIEDTY